MNEDFPLNLILYGPPGTGKTFAMVDLSLQILGIDTSSLSRKEKKERYFDEKIKEGRIIFTTFHQNMTYEDFVEGIKPVVLNGSISYKVQSGIFKSLCDRINGSGIRALSYSSKNLDSSFDKSYFQFISKLKEIYPLIDPSDPLVFKSRKTRARFLRIDSENLVIFDELKSLEETISKAKLKKIYEKFNNPEEVSDIIRQIQEDEEVDIEWTTGDFAVFLSLKEFESTKRIHYKKNVKNTSDNFILIIDEINRGNVSQIFGELITLLEPEKRLGNEESLELILPYSRERFGVPSNLYLLATMNSADRSVETLDTALRRRFSFRELAPEPSILKIAGKLKDGLLDTLDIAELLTIINSRLERLLDREHRIGHSYFLKVDSWESLRDVFQFKVIPLLKEYFFNDYGKIGLVLGQGFVEVKDRGMIPDFAYFPVLDSSIYQERILFEIKNLSITPLIEFQNAIQILKNESSFRYGE